MHSPKPLNIPTHVQPQLLFSIHCSSFIWLKWTFLLPASRIWGFAAKTYCHSFFKSNEYRRSTGSSISQKDRVQFPGSRKCPRARYKPFLFLLPFQTEWLRGDQRSLSGCVGVPVWAQDQSSGWWVSVGSLSLTHVLLSDCQITQSSPQMQTLISLSQISGRIPAPIRWCLLLSHGTTNYTVYRPDRWLKIIFLPYKMVPDG